MDYESDTAFANLQRPPNRNPNYACFYYKSVEGQGGKLIDKVYILIISPGQKLTEVRRPASDFDKAEYPEAWVAFQEGKEAPLNGTPIEMLSGLMPSRIIELKAMGIRTIESLAAVPDQNMRNLGMDASDLRNRAKAFTEKNSAEIQALRATNADLEARIAQLEKNAKVKVEQPPVKRPVGRPRKTAEVKVDAPIDRSGSTG